MTISPKEEQRHLTELLIRNADIFATDLSQLPRCTLSKHTIHTGDAPPQRSYKHSPAARKEIERQTADMLANDIIEPSNGSWPAAIFFNKNEDGRHTNLYRLSTLK